MTNETMATVSIVMGKTNRTRKKHFVLAGEYKTVHMCHLEKKHLPPSTPIPPKQQQKIYSVLYYQIKIAFLNLKLLCILKVN